MQTHRPQPSRAADPAAPRRPWVSRAVTWLLGAGCLALGLLIWQDMRPGSPAATMPTGIDVRVSGTLEAEAAYEREADPASWLGAAGDADGFAEAVLAGLDPSMAPLDHEPANLAPPPGGQRQWRFQRDMGEGVREQVAAWRITDRSLDALAAFYEEQARKRGFVPLPSAQGAVRTTEDRTEDRTDVVLLSFTADGGAGDEPLRVLSVRLAERGESIHALIALR